MGFPSTHVILKTLAPLEDEEISDWLGVGVRERKQASEACPSKTPCWR